MPDDYFTTYLNNLSDYYAQKALNDKYLEELKKKEEEREQEKLKREEEKKREQEARTKEEEKEAREAAKRAVVDGEKEERRKEQEQISRSVKLRQFVSQQQRLVQALAQDPEGNIGKVVRAQNTLLSG